MNQSQRDASIFLHIGAKKTGKTTETRTTCFAMVEMQDKPVLVYNIGNQSHYDDFKQIQLDDLARFNQLAKKAHTPLFQIRTVETDRLFALINIYVRNSLIVLEDATSYAVGNLSKPFRELLLNNRNHGNDLIINLHSLKDPAPFLFRSCEYIMLRQTSDNPERLPDKVLAPEKVTQAMYEILDENQETGNQWASRLISIQDLM